VLARVPAGVRIGITGVGGYLPGRVVESAELAGRLGVTADWIAERSGIRERRVASEQEDVTSLATAAGADALAAGRTDPESLDLVVVATATPDFHTPAVAARVAAALGASRAAAYDVSAACTGFVYALTQAYGSIAAGLARRALVVGAEVLSRVTDWDDRGTAILFGDGGGAVTLDRVATGGFLGFELGCDGSRADELILPVGGVIEMNGAAVYRFSTREVPASVNRLLDRCGLTIDEVDVYAPHQSNMRIMDHTIRTLGLPRETLLANIDRVGNTSAASIPLVLLDAVRAGRLERGTIVLMTAVGAGLTWGSALLAWDVEAA
jgi:3-oxoacyl-[acyl-carrier-protein] synthase-3